MSLRQNLRIADPEPGRCANCRAPLPEPPPPFCSQCGQETRVRPPTLLEFIQHIGGAYISTEGALWRTLWRLLLLPGQLTMEYFAGRRRYFVQPVRLYLTISVLVIIGVKLSGALSFDTPPPEKVIHFDAKDKAESEFFNLGGHRAGMHAGELYCERLPESFCERLQSRLQMDPKATQALVSDMPRRFVDHLGTGMFFMLPMFALLLKLIFVDTRRRYTEHLVFSLHLHSFWFAAAPLLLSGIPPLIGLGAAAINIYPLVALQRVYRRRWWSTFLRASLLFFLHSVALSFGLSFVLLWAFFS